MSKCECKYKKEAECISARYWLAFASTPLYLLTGRGRSALPAHTDAEEKRRPDSVHEQGLYV